MNVLRDKRTNRVVAYSKEKFIDFDKALFESVEVDGKDLDKGMIVYCNEGVVSFTQTLEMQRMSRSIEIDGWIATAKTVKKAEDSVLIILSIIEKLK